MKLLGFIISIFLGGLLLLSNSVHATDALPTLPLEPIESQNKNKPIEDINNDLNNKNLNNGETAGGDGCDPSKDIMLNISVPFIGRCIKKDPAARQTSDERGNTTSGNVFPKLMGGLVRLVMTIIYIIGFLGILIGGFMISASGVDPELKSKGLSLIKLVIGGLILVGLSGIILNFINPDFFSTASDAAP